jgi:hypothetical protein
LTRLKINDIKISWPVLYIGGTDGT